MRIVAVSATLPNISEIAEFLVANEAYAFDESFRPVPLQTHVIGMGNAGKKEYMFYSKLDREVPSIVKRYSGGRPAIVFVHSKNDTEKLADTLAKCRDIAVPGQSEMAGKTRLTKLQRVLLNSIAYHHAGLELDDRRLVEQCFASGKIKVLCTTSTLAMGVNLPARLVVIKGTKAYRGSDGYQDLDQASLLQMIGRAGRPGHDTAGTAIIMTENASKEKFRRMAASGLEPAKSRIMSTLEEILNAEISQKVVSDLGTAFKWIQGTLFYAQVVRNPKAYGIQVVSEHSVDTHLMGLLRDAFRKLRAIGVIELHEGSEVIPRDACHIMCQHLVDYETMQIFSNLPFNASQSDLLKEICKIERLQRPVRRNEKKTLNLMHKDHIRYQCVDKGLSRFRIQRQWEKAFVLLQMSIGRIEVQDNFTLRNEAFGMVEFASRMLAASEEYAVRATKNGRVAVQSLRLRRSLETRLWNESSGGVLGQFSSLDDRTLKSLMFNGICSFQNVLSCTEQRLEHAARRAPPFGSNLIKAVQGIVANSMKINAKVVFAEGTRTPELVLCDLVRNPSAVADPSSEDNPDVNYTVIAYTDRPNGCLLYKRNVSTPQTINFRCPPTFGKITIHLIASIIGLDGKAIQPKRSACTYAFESTHIVD